MWRQYVKGMFRRAFRKKENICFQKATLEESTEHLCNPARGWYQLYTFCVEEEPDFAYLSSCLDEQETLALLSINIGAFRSEDLPREMLERIVQILSFFRDRHKDIILRVTYDHQGKALEREPSLFSQVLRHLEQVGALLQQFGESIFIYQGMLIGNWGEMHASKFLDIDYLERMAEVLKKYDRNTFLAVRRPVQWRYLHQKAQEECIDAQRMGLYNDAIFGSATDLGTFGEMESKKAGWSNAWLREEELDFIEKLCKKAPNGGEVVLGDGFWKTLPQEELLADLKRMHITYLNQLYDRQVLNSWKECTYAGKGAWTGASLYDYIGAHLGYRFWIRDVRVTALKKRGIQTDYEVEIDVENVGFANIYQEVIVSLEWIDSRGDLQRKELSTDLRDCDSGTVKCIRYFVDVSQGELHISMHRKHDHKIIYFANKADADGRIYLGSICQL